MLSLSDLRRRIETGELSPEAALRLGREAIDAREGEVGAFVRLATDARAGAGPLAGIAVGVKDIIDTADLPTEMGSSIYRGWQPKADAAVVAALRRLGATVVGKTTTTAFASSDPTATRNPLNLAHTPGGSSAGSAAAVAAGMVPLALGTQTGGSVIRPASFCGVAAIKPSFRLLPTVGVKCYAYSLDTVGLFAAGVADLTHAYGLLTGRSAAPSAPQPLRIGLLRQSYAGTPEPGSVTALERAADALRAVGAIVHESGGDDALAALWSAQPTIEQFEAASALGWEFDHRRDDLPPNIRANLETGRQIGAGAYDEARRSAHQGRRDAKRLFEGYDALLTYAAPGPAPAGLSSTGDPRYNRALTLLGAPCVTLPAWRDGGLPVGVQVVAPFAQDVVALQVSAILEGALALSS